MFLFSPKGTKNFAESFLKKSEKKNQELAKFIFLWKTELKKHTYAMDLWEHAFTCHSSAPSQKQFGAKFFYGSISMGS